MERVGVIGLGYVGLPVALGFAKRMPTVGFDIDTQRVAGLSRGFDHTGEVSAEELGSSGLTVTDDPKALAGCTMFVVTVPTPIDAHRRPDLRAMRAASETVGAVLTKGAVVVYESTVYPGVTEEICGPILARVSGLSQGVDFKLGYSPERINPGDKAHTLERIVKVVAGEDAETLDRVAAAYGAIVDAGIHRAPSIQVAEMAKVIENTQRDINIALMNELALICDALDIPTRDVLAAANTKWNFLPFTPGLVGGHCIGVDPYYLTTKAEQVGYHPEVILAGRRINDGMGKRIARRLVKALTRSGKPVAGSRIGVLGVTFKENVRDIRNSRVPDIVAELQEFGAEPLVHDPLADAAETEAHTGLRLRDLSDLVDLDAMVLAVPHAAYRDAGTAALLGRVRAGGVVFDVKWVIDRDDVPAQITVLSL